MLYDMIKNPVWYDCNKILAVFGMEQCAVR